MGGPGRATCAAPGVSLSTFAATWYGHTRGLTITSSGIGKETIYSGCCALGISLTFKLSNPRLTAQGIAIATAVLTSIHVGPGCYSPGAPPPPSVGQVATVTLNVKAGIISSPFTNTYYCDAAADATGACGICPWT